MKEMDHLSIYISENYVEVVQKIVEDDELPKNYEHGFLMPYSIPIGKENQRFSIVTKNGNFQSFGYPVSLKKIQKEFKAGIYEELYDFTSESNMRFIPPHEDYWGIDNTINMISCVRRIYDRSEKEALGFVLVEQPSSHFNSILNTTHMEKLLIVDSSGKSIPMFRGEKSIQYEQAKIDSNYSITQDVFIWNDLNEQDKECLYIAKNLGYENWSLLLEIEKAHLLQSTYSSLSSMLIILFSLYIGLIPLVFVAMRYISKPFSDLRQQLDQVNLDQFEIEPVTPFAKDEIQLLNDALGRMIDRLNKSASEKATMHSRELHASFVALQAQINPHFLFNILQVIMILAQENRNQELIRALRALSEMLRYVTTSSPKVVNLHEEIDHIKNYLTLMKFSKGDQLAYDIIFDEEADFAHLKIPRMSLQPLVENAFTHGFSKVLPPWKLSIEIIENNNTLQICISNNGMGMTKDNILKLMQKIDHFLERPMEFVEKMEIGGMGLISSLSRFKNLYGDAFSYGFLVPEEKVGFSITIKIRKDFDIENINS
ncbi:MAG: histidine kinase [Clostridiaceae bacterium]|nr:histidine kinase [Clostridiaceae bacterium]